MPKILIVEDEPKVAAFLKQGLEEAGFEPMVVYDGQLAVQISERSEFDLVLMDIVIPYMNGIALCRHIKERRPEMPIIMLTALGTTDDKLTGFDAGADDYLVKPFEFKELLARIRALLKRSTGKGNQTNHHLKIADLELDTEKKVAIRAGKTIDLTAKEYALLEYLIKNRERVVSRSDIAEKVWEITFDTGTNVVDVYVNILRKKIDKDYPIKLIKTKIGMGYMLSEGL